MMWQPALQPGYYETWLPDDYHTLQTLDIHVVMARLVQHLPDHVHLILTTRSDPPLSLERLRGRQQLNEIRSAQLRSTYEEAGQLLRQILGDAATDEITTLLEEGTEGWAVGLQLTQCRRKRYGQQSGDDPRI